MEFAPEQLSMTAASDDESLVAQQTTGEDRVRMVATQLSEPRTANWIADEADWSHEPTTRVLQRLVDDGVVRRDDSGPHTTYYPEYRRQAIQEAMAIRDSGQSAEAVTETLTELKSRVRAWEAEFDVDSPTQLRATIADDDLDPEAEQRRAEIAREWAHIERRIRIVGFALREWEFLAPTTDDPAATG
jgi:predicted transcriptional regulator